MITRLYFFLLIGVLSLPLVIHAQGLSSAPIDQALGRSGQKTGDVYRVSFPRTDLHVSVHGLAIKPGLALGSWAAFIGTDDNAAVMGDLVLLEDEVNPVIEKLRSSDFEISAVHNHLIDETPHVMYVHYMGHGATASIFDSIYAAWQPPRPLLENLLRPMTKRNSACHKKKAVEDSVGRKGTLKGGVLSYGVPRAEPVTMASMTIAPAAGVAEAINFQGAGSANVATTGDFVLTAEEVNPVISELQAHKISVTALHSHMLTEQPRLFFMHFWAVGSPDSVGAGIAAALKKISTK